MNMNVLEHNQTCCTIYFVISDCGKETPHLVFLKAYSSISLSHLFSLFFRSQILFLSELIWLLGIGGWFKRISQDQRRLERWFVVLPGLYLVKYSRLICLQIRKFSSYVLERYSKSVYIIFLVDSLTLKHPVNVHKLFE